MAGVSVSICFKVVSIGKPTMVMYLLSLMQRKKWVIILLLKPKHLLSMAPLSLVFSKFQQLLLLVTELFEGSRYLLAVHAITKQTVNIPAQSFIKVGF